jgi:tRNA A37 threonylcarbamoyladenosine modification protein TsaB
VLTGKIVARKQFQGNLSAENFASIIQKFLLNQKLKFSDVKKIAVKTGPGFFSRVRTGVVAANALAFALDTKVIAVRSELGLQKASKMPGQSFVRPHYGSAPNITKSKGRT